MVIQWWFSGGSVVVQWWFSGGSVVVVVVNDFYKTGAHTYSPHPPPPRPHGCTHDPDYHQHQPHTTTATKASRPPLLCNEFSTHGNAYATVLEAARPRYARIHDVRGARDYAGSALRLMRAVACVHTPRLACCTGT